ncbi:MAG TPA: 5-formyltetrahydrofolate cyclo-ligase [Steroidobacteraceae bacterium]|nr:5-formyltetrahydrofolate cyclo-ligase [Steroidobacteraceae bacterium]
MPLPPHIASRRKAERARLIQRRLAAPAPDHARWSARIEACLREGFGLLERGVVGFCWPFQGEFDARPFVRDLRRRGARAALPVVIAKGRPLEFREWWPGVAMINGVYDLPVPDGTAVLTPDALLIPAVGIGAIGDRLGYGGGFFDRTLAALDPKPLAVGLAFELSRMATTEPQPHDVLMDFVVTEDGIEAAVEGGLERIGAEDCQRRLAALAAERGLPHRSIAVAPAPA